MTTCDVQLGSVHVLGLGIIRSIATVNKMNPRPCERMLLAAVNHITLHLYATAKYCRTQKACQVKIIANCLFVIINDGNKCVIANLNKQVSKHLFIWHLSKQSYKVLYNKKISTVTKYKTIKFKKKHI